MLTKCSSITEVSKALFLGEALVPSVQMNITIGDQPVEVVFVMPTYRQSSLRLLLEFVDGIRLDPTNCDEYRQAIQTIVSKNKLSVDVDNFAGLLESLIVLRTSEDTFKEAELSFEELGGLARFVASVGGQTFLSDFSDWIEFSRPIEDLNEDSFESVVSLMNDADRFMSLFKTREKKTEYCSVGTRVIYPEDLYASPYIKLNELNRYTQNLYSQFKSFRNTVNEYELTDAQKELFDKFICDCGGELVIRRSDEGDFTTVSCVNPYCKFKMLWGFADLVSNLGVRGVGAKTFKDAVDNIWLARAIQTGKSEVRYSDLLDQNFLSFFSGSARDALEQFKEALANFKEPTKELVRLSGLPYVGEYAGTAVTKKVLEEAVDFVDFVDACQRSKVKDLRLMFNLFCYLDDLRSLTSVAKCQDMENVFEFNICITHGVSLEQGNGEPPLKFKNKKAFVDFLNEFLEENEPERSVRVVLKSRVSQDVHVLINDSGESSTNDSTARSYNIPVIRSCDIVNVLREVVPECQETKTTT